MRRIALAIFLSATMAAPPGSPARAAEPDLPEMPLAPDRPPDTAPATRRALPPNLPPTLLPDPPATTAAPLVPPPHLPETPASAPASAPATTPAPAPPVELPAPLPENHPPATQPAGLTLAWACPEHPSGLFYARDEATLEFIAENFAPASAPAAPLAGQLVFAARPAAGEALKPLVITPIAATTVAAGARVKLSVRVRFPAPGDYVLQHDGREVPSAIGAALQCIFAPRGVDARNPDTPWITPLPMPATVSADFLPDFCARTSIRRFVLDETWGPVPGRDVRVLTHAQRDVLLKGLAAARAQLILRWSLAPEAKSDPRHTAAFHAYVSAFATRGKGHIAGVLLDAGHALPSPQEVERFRACYLAAYDAVKKANKATLMLGAGSIVNNDLFLLAPPPPAKGENLRAYIDAHAAADDPADVRRALERGQQWIHTPVWVLPRKHLLATAPTPAAALKALGASVIPVDPADRNVPPHLLGGAVATERLHPELAPHIAIFQGDGYALAAIAGQGAGTLLDIERAAWRAGGKAQAAAPSLLVDAGGALAKPHLELADDTESMRVVDARGNAVDCRVGDMLHIPLTSQLYYVLAAGSADDITGLLRTAMPRGIPFAKVNVLEHIHPAADKEGSLKVQIINISPADLDAAVNAWTAKTGRPATLAESAIKALAPSKAVELTLPLPAGQAPAEMTLDITRTGPREIQRQVLR